MHSRVDNTLADGVYELVPEFESGQSEAQDFSVADCNQDLSKDSEGPKASEEGKHRSISPNF